MKINNWTLLLFFCAVIISGCTKPGNENQGLLTHVQTQKVIQKDIPVVISSFGNLSAFEDINIQSRVPGEIVKVYFHEGSCVKTGALLFSIDDKTYNADLEIDEAALEQDMASLKLKKNIFMKDQKIFASGGLSRQTYDKMLTEITMAEAQVKSDQAHIQLDKINLQYCSVVSPVKGIIGIRKVDAGNIITTNDVLANVKTIDPLYVDFTVPEKDIFEIKDALQKKTNLKILISVNKENSNGNDQPVEYSGKLSFLNNKANDTSGTVSLRAIVPNKKMELIPGLYVDVKIIIGQRKNALLIPQSGVQTGKNGHYVFIVDSDNKAELVHIQKIGVYKDYCIVEGRIKPEEKVIVTGLQNLKPGDAVKIEAPGVGR